MPVILDGPTPEWINPGERDLFQLKSRLLPAAVDNLLLSPASSLVNNVKNAGPEPLVPDTTMPALRSLF
jgi:putative SOS response-associated peptidase YedK